MQKEIKTTLAKWWFWKPVSEYITCEMIGSNQDRLVIASYPQRRAQNIASIRNRVCTVKQLG